MFNIFERVEIKLAKLKTRSALQVASTELVSPSPEILKC